MTFQHLAPSPTPTPPAFLSSTILSVLVNKLSYFLEKKAKIALSPPPPPPIFSNITSPLHLCCKFFHFETCVPNLAERARGRGGGGKQVRNSRQTKKSKKYAIIPCKWRKARNAWFSRYEKKSRIIPRKRRIRRNAWISTQEMTAKKCYAGVSTQEMKSKKFKGGGTVFPIFVSY